MSKLTRDHGSLWHASLHCGSAELCLPCLLSECWWGGGDGVTEITEVIEVTEVTLYLGIAVSECKAQ